MAEAALSHQKSGALLASIQAKKSAALKLQARTTFIKTYRDNWVALIQDCVKWDKSKPTWGLAFYQQEAIDKLQHGKHREAVISPHGAGKSTTGSLLVHAFILTRDGEEEWKLPTTAGSYNQLTHFFWPEIRKWTRLLDWVKLARPEYDLQTELLKINFKGKTGEAFAVAVTQKELIEGAHADQLLFIKDEAKAIPADIFDATEGAFSQAGIDGREAFDIALSTPGDRAGRLFEMTENPEKFSDWDIKMISLEDTIVARRNTQKWADDRAKQWGVTSQVYINRVLGRFAADDASGMIPFEWIQAAADRWREKGVLLRPDDDTAPLLIPRRLVSVGGDCADGGVDDSVLAELWACEDDRGFKGFWSPPLEYFSAEDTMQFTGRIAQKLRAKPGSRAVVDNIGIGAGVLSRLKEQRLKVIGFNASNRWEGVDLSEELLFDSKRARMWWFGRELLDPQNNFNVAIPPDERLMNELATPKYKLKSSGKVSVESKDDIRKRREGKSTDAADGWLQSCWNEIADEEPDLTGLAGQLVSLGAQQSTFREEIGASQQSIYEAIGGLAGNPRITRRP